MAKRQTTSNPDLSDEDGGRWAAKTALWAVLESNWGELINPEQRAALFRLLMALDSLEHGKVHDMLKPSSIENRPVDTLDMRCNKALVAAAMDALMQPVNGAQGKSQEQAARSVARIVQGRQNNVFGRDVTWQKIRRWRQDLNSRASRACIDHDVNLFHSLRAVAQKSTTPPKLFVKHLLDTRPW